jgi:hypothetical protein
MSEDGLHGSVVVEPMAFLLRHQSRLPLAALASLVVLKLGVLLTSGPTMLPDSTGYIAYADAILDGSFRHVDLAGTAQPVMLTRIIGFPALIAAGKIIAGQYWAWAVILLQFAVSSCATVLLYQLARTFRLGVWPSLFVAVAQATAMQFVVDQSVLTDSLCGSTMTMAACILGLIALRRRPVGLLSFLAVGLLIAAAFLVRPVIEYMVVGFCPLIVAAATVEAMPLRRWTAAALVFLPVIATHVAYAQWNRERVGAPVVSTIAQAALFSALIEAAAYDSAIFSGSTPFDDAGRRTIKLVQSPPADREIGPDVEPGIILHRDYGWNAIRISQAVTQAYLRAYWDHPAAMVRHFLANLKETQLHQAFRPTETIRDVMLWNTGSEHDFGRIRAVRDGEWWMIPAVIWHFLDDTVSTVIFSAFLLVTPIRLSREGLTAETSVSTGFLCAYLVVAGLYAAVHTEPRYLTPVVPLSIVIGVVNIAWLIAQYRRDPSQMPVAA